MYKPSSTTRTDPSVDTSSPKSPATLHSVLSALEETNPQVKDEIESLLAIFGDEAISLHPKVNNPWKPGAVLRLLIETNLPSHNDIQVSFIASLPSTYPESNAPQLQLSGKYIGGHGIDSELFGLVTRIYMHEGSWNQGDVVLFEGIEKAREECDKFYENKVSQLARKEALNPHVTQDDLDSELAQRTAQQAQISQASNRSTQSTLTQDPISLPEDCKLFSSEPVVDRKSVFVGHACRIQNPQQVSRIVAYLLSDKKIAKAHHPAMLAYRCRGIGDVIHQDNDDDGETAAGSRLAHLLQILDLDNVLVVVTRWYGGVQLGADRFKHINQAARDALVLGGFIKASAKK